MWISLDKLPSLWMLIQSVRLGEGGASLKEARGQLCTVKQTSFFFSEPDTSPNPSAPVSESAFMLKKKKMQTPSRIDIPKHFDRIIMGQHLIRVSVAKLKTRIHSFRRPQMCLYTALGILRVTHYRSPIWNQERAWSWNEIWWRGVTAATEHTKMWGWILQPAGVVWAASLMQVAASGGMGRVKQMQHLGPGRNLFCTLLPPSHSDITDGLRKSYLELFLCVFWVVLVLFWRHWHLLWKSQHLLKPDFRF